MFKILSTYICWKKYIKCNIWRVVVRPSYIQDARFLKIKTLMGAQGVQQPAEASLFCAYCISVFYDERVVIKFYQFDAWRHASAAV